MPIPVVLPKNKCFLYVLCYPRSYVFRQIRTRSDNRFIASTWVVLYSRDEGVQTLSSFVDYYDPQKIPLVRQKCDKNQNRPASLPSRRSFSICPE